MFPAKSEALRHAAASAITFYQRRLSPFKGFSCAHKVLHGGDSCSQFVKGLILELGPHEAMVAPRVRLASCWEAKEALRTDAFWSNTHREGRRRRGSRRRRWFGRGDDLEDASDALEDFPDGDASGCEPGSVDCGSCDSVPETGSGTRAFPA